MLASTSHGNAGHIRYQYAQEEIWVAALKSNLTNWSEHRRFVFGVRPETPVLRWNNLTYDEIYPMGFANVCRNEFQNGQCNVQINDASVVVYDLDNQPHYLLYFTLFENYRWHSSLLGEMTSDGPTDSRTQNIQTIGLAISSDGSNWTFVDKVLLEQEIDSDGEPILGAWSPSALVDPKTGLVDVYFHDALGTKQYVAHFSNGIDLLGIDRLNRHDEKYRTNLDVLYRNGRYEVMYNDNDYAIARTSFTRVENFGTECGEVIIVSADQSEIFPTPHQFLHDDGRLFMYYWDFHHDDKVLINTYR
jgi:hypothetical protein